MAPVKKRTEFPVGERFGNLIVLSVHRSDNNRFWRVMVQCDCGSVPKSVALHHVESGATVSCGCRIYSANLTHGHCRKNTNGASTTWNRWKDMKARCRPNSRARRWYADRGIAVCKRWADSFEAFLEDMGECPEGLELDRIDVDKGYGPGNCRWATKSEQVRNRRYKREKSPYKNVFPYGRSGWKYGAMFGGEMVQSTATFTDPESAAHAFNKFAVTVGIGPIREVGNQPLSVGPLFTDKGECNV